MTLQVFALHDSKAEAYLRPFFAQSKGLALRSMLEVLSDKEHPVTKYPADYHLFHIAEYDDATGIITPLSVKENLGCALDLSALKQTGYSPERAERIERAVTAVNERVLNGN